MLRPQVVGRDPKTRLKSHQSPSLAVRAVQRGGPSLMYSDVPARLTSAIWRIHASCYSELNRCCGGDDFVMFTLRAPKCLQLLIIHSASNSESLMFYRRWDLLLTLMNISIRTLALFEKLVIYI